MKDLCIVAYVFGKNYQQYIPLYILSALNTYPNYDVRIYLDEKLDSSIKEQLGVLTKYEESFDIIEDFSSVSKFSRHAKKNQQIQKSQRWLFYDEAFSNYKAIYIGDIDLLILPEEKNLYDQHINHMNFLQLPYSNISRKKLGIKKISFKTITRNLLKFGIKETVKFYLFEKNEIIKMSGLHFIKTKEYFKYVIPLIEEYYKELNLLAEGNSKKYNLCKFNNESLLRDLMIDAGFGAPELVVSTEYNIEINPNTTAFRPHHGLHLGIFRGDISILNESKVINSSIYLSYYKSFIDLKKEKEYQDLAIKFSSNIIDLLKKMENYYINIRK